MLNKPIIDELLNLADDPATSLELFIELFDDFQISALTLISTIIESNDLNDIEGSAHKLKSSSGMLGMKVLSALSEEVMHAACDQDVVKLERLRLGLLNTYESQVNALRKYLDSYVGGIRVIV